ncbi:hypothetical protein PEBR_27080 [Penicillium brasilianum]|uniref:Nascent polypeptide-associated complex subunit beta n=1 Tax=Penicillium brasilianum TaxID=104259 RepID=A0A1S9RJD6_PENBI|nr:hypothetical protein PEBR_27080 [Penicillium brasilianum]
MGRIVVTGGSGRAGGIVIAELLEAGHTILNLDLKPMTHSAVHTLQTELTDSGQVFNALSGQWFLSEPFPEGLPPRPDAVIHLAGYARNMIVPNNETFRANTQGTYNIIDAACILGIRKVIIASSITVYGEDQDVNPTDTYALAKLCGERVARGFAARYGTDIYTLRIGHVIGPDDYNGDVFYGYVHEPSQWKVHGWSYTDARDLGGMCEAALRTDGLGFQVFNATNDTITNLQHTEELLRSHFPQTLITRRLGKFEAPLSNAKIKRMLGFEEKHPWRSTCGANWLQRISETEDHIRARPHTKLAGCASSTFPSNLKPFNRNPSTNHLYPQPGTPTHLPVLLRHILVAVKSRGNTEFLQRSRPSLSRTLSANTGKGTPRRKVKKVHRTADADDKKLQTALKKLNVQPIQGIEEVNMFKEDGNVIHFGNPRVHASVPSNTFALYGHGEEKELTELVPGILNQLGPDSLASLRKLAESYQNMQKAQGDKKDDDEDDIPDLVEGENFESKVE